MNAYEERVFQERGWVVMDDSGCLSNDPYCSNGNAPLGSYEAYSGSLCGACEDRQIEERIAANTIVAGCPVCEEPDCGYDAVNDICPNATGYRISR